MSAQLTAHSTADLNGRSRFEYNKLRGRIVEKFGTIDSFSKELNISKVQLSKKLNGRAGISQSDIITWSNMLDIDTNDIGIFFFT